MQSGKPNETASMGGGGPPVSAPGTRSGKASAARTESRPRVLPRNWATALRLCLQGREHGLGQALALEAMAGEFGVGHLGQKLEPGGVGVGFLDDGE
jgi:hypothetical protein